MHNARKFAFVFLSAAAAFAQEKPEGHDGQKPATVYPGRRIAGPGARAEKLAGSVIFRSMVTSSGLPRWMGSVESSFASGKPIARSGTPTLDFLLDQSK